MHVVGENVFLQFIGVKIPWQSFYLRKKQRRESLATCVRNEVLA